MAHPPDHGFCTNGVVRLVFVLVAVCLVGYTIRPSLHWSLKEKGSCPQCPCDCSKDFDPIPVGEIHFSMFVWEIWCMVEGRYMYKSMAEGGMGNWRGVAER